MFTGTCGIKVLAQIEVRANLETGVTHTHIQQRFKPHFRGRAKGERDDYLLYIPWLSIDMI